MKKGLRQAAFFIFLTLGVSFFAGTQLTRLV